MYVLTHSLTRVLNIVGVPAELAKHIPLERVAIAQGRSTRAAMIVHVALPSLSLRTPLDNVERPVNFFC